MKPEDRSQELRFFSKKLKKRLAIIPLQVYNKSIEREHQSTRQEDKDMTNSNEINKYRLPNTTTPEELECRWSKVLNYGDKVLLSGYYYNGADMPSYFGAVYEFTTDDHTAQGTIELQEVSELVFEDDGHAIAWGLRM